MSSSRQKLLVIIGPTTSGKTKLAVKLAGVFSARGGPALGWNGAEIVSADSRQVYKGMDIGTGKDLKDYFINITNNNPPAGGQKSNKFQILIRQLADKFQRNHKSQIIKIACHCIDIISPKTEFNLAKYMKCARRAIDDIHKRGKLPILAGGTGLYAQAIVDGYNLSGVKPDRKLRARLENMTVEELQKKLKKLDPRFNDEVKNKRYLIRYIEMVKQAKQPVKELLTKQGSEYDCLVLGIKFPREVINKRIDERLVDRIEKEGMIEEVERLHKKGISWKRLESFGLEYRFVSQYLQGKLSREEMIAKLKTAIHQFAKRQMTWYRRWERQGRPIEWVGDYVKTRRLVKAWLENKKL